MDGAELPVNGRVVAVRLGLPRRGGILPGPWWLVGVPGMIARALLVVLIGSGLAACGSTAPRSESAERPFELATWRDVRALSVPDAVPSLSYGTEPQQHGELRLPPGVPGPFPVLVLIPGDCWTSADESAGYLRPLAASLSTLGVATWTIEYRRPGGAGDWTDTLRDVALATDHLRALAQTYPLNLKRVVAAGHAGGAELALWLAQRGRIAEDDPLYVRRPLSIHGMIGLAAVTETAQDRDVCARGGEATPAATPAPLIEPPLGVPQWFVHGAQDALVPPATVMRYVEAARRKGDRVTLGITTNAGHYEPVVPASSTWMTLQQAVIAALHD